MQNAPNVKMKHLHERKLAIFLASELEELETVRHYLSLIVRNVEQESKDKENVWDCKLAVNNFHLYSSPLPNNNHY